MLITAGLAMSLKRKLVKTVCFASAAPWAFIRFLFHGDPAVLVTNVYLQDQEGLLSEFTRIVRKKVIILTTVNIEDIEKSRVSNKVEEERYPETFRRLCHHQSAATESEGRFL